jgi:hypothetical protein
MEDLRDVRFEQSRRLERTVLSWGKATRKDGNTGSRMTEETERKKGY